jgi:hypothetical protein
MVLELGEVQLGFSECAYRAKPHRREEVAGFTRSRSWRAVPPRKQ